MLTVDFHLLWTQFIPVKLNRQFLELKMPLCSRLPVGRWYMPTREQEIAQSNQWSVDNQSNQSNVDNHSNAIESKIPIERNRILPRKQPFNCDSIALTIELQLFDRV